MEEFNLICDEEFKLIYNKLLKVLYVSNGQFYGDIFSHASVRSFCYRVCEEILKAHKKKVEKTENKPSVV